MSFPRPPARFVALRAAAFDGVSLEGSMCEQASFWNEDDALDWQADASGDTCSTSVLILTERATGRVLTVYSGQRLAQVGIANDGRGNIVFHMLRDRSHDEPPPLDRSRLASSS